MDTRINNTNETRSSRNAKLYLDIDDNINEIDVTRLKRLVSNDSKLDNRSITNNINVIDKKRKVNEEKVYDINKILEQARLENNKLKNIEEVKIDNKLLTTLGSQELSLEDINSAKKLYQEAMYDRKKELIIESELAITRELKYKDLTNDNEENDNDLFSDLKGLENTIVTKPVKPDEYTKDNVFTESNKLKNIEADIHSGDTRDIDIIKDIPNANNNEFFTNVYSFSMRDFADDDDEDFFEEPITSNGFKIFLLILAIVILISVIIYFVLNSKINI